MASQATQWHCVCGQSNASQPLAEMFAEPLEGTRLRLAPLQERSGSEMPTCLCRRSQPASCPSHRCAGGRSLCEKQSKLGAVGREEAERELLSPTLGT